MHILMIFNGNPNGMREWGRTSDTSSISYRLSSDSTEVSNGRVINLKIWSSPEVLGGSGAPIASTKVVKGRNIQCFGWVVVLSFLFTHYVWIQCTLIPVAQL